MQPSPNRSTGMEPVAIIGMASFFAEAHNLAAYWDNIVRERNSITDVPASRWNIADYYDPDPSAPDKTYCKRGGFLPDIDFDPLEFGLPPNILEVTDVSQLLALVAARQAFEDAGYGAERGHNFEHTGVILGVCGGQKLMTPLIARLQYPVWEQAMRSCGLSEERIAEAIAKIKLAYIRWEENAFPGMLGNVIAGRIANRFDLGGINCVTDAACASSLSALQMALSELSAHRCDMMLTGGVDTDNSPFMYMCFSKTPAFSRQEVPRPFDAESDGMMVGEGLGMLVLKRLADAERDGDRVYAVIRGIGSSSDGRYKSIYAPRSEGQARALRRAYANAGVPAASIGLIEAHGTGTVAGDLCEVQTLREVFSEDNPRQAHIALGSVKSQIGHTKAAAGAAGLIKAALALHHRVLPPTINVAAPNPKFGLEGSPLYLNTHARPWLRTADAPPRRAAVSAFGFGGTNFHVVLEEYAADHQQPYRMHQTAQEIILAAPTPDALHERCAKLAEALDGPQAPQIFADLAAATQTLALPAEQARVGFVAAGPTEAREHLLRAGAMISGQPSAERLQHPKGVFYQRRGINTAGRVVALFPGQGSQYLEMGRELTLNFPPLRDLLGRADAHSAGVSLSEVLFPPPAFTSAAQAAQNEQLQRTEYAQPAIGALSVGMYGLLRAAGFQPAMTAGHSFGELTALWAAGAISDDDYLALAHARGQAMAPPSDRSFDAGAMLAVAAEPAAVQAIVGRIPSVTAANLNARDQVVLAGPTAAIDQARQLLRAAGLSATALPVSAAFHTPLVRHAHAPFSRAVQACSFNPSRVPVYANATAQPYPADPHAIKQQLADQLLQPVRFLDQIEQIYAAGGAIFVEIGPRSVLTNLVKRILGDRPHIAVALNPSRESDSDRQLREAVVQLRVAGVPMRGIDPYQREQAPAPTAKRRGPTVRLNGGNYVSEPTRTAYTDAIARGPLASEPISSEKGQTMTIFPAGVQLPSQEPYPSLAPVDQPDTPPAHAPADHATPPAAASPVELMTQLQAHQREILQVHQQFLTYQHEYVGLLLQLPQSAAAHHEGGLAAMHQIQTETLRIHQQFLTQQGDYAAGLLQLIQQQVALGVATPAPIGDHAGRRDITPIFAPAVPPSRRDGAPPPAPNGTPPISIDSSSVVPQFPGSAAPTPDPALMAQLTAGLLTVVSEKTGYPRETLELDMDMESDLGIDSIKRVDILGTMQTRFTLPRLAPEELAELRTLAQVVAHLQATGDHASRRDIAPIFPPEPLAPVVTVMNNTPPTPNDTPPISIDSSSVVPQFPGSAAPTPDPALMAQLTEGLLTVVSEKTGYPRETLELDMDMESDLGIDSIKRVDILGTMQTRFTLPRLAPEELAELRTLAQVVAHLQAAGDHASRHEATPATLITSVTNSSDSGSMVPRFSGSVPATSVATAPAILVRLPAPDQLETPPIDGWSCVITDDGTPAAGLLATELSELGWQPVVLRLPTTVVGARPALPRGVGRVALHDMSEEQLTQALQMIAESYGPVGGFIHLHPQPTALAKSNGMLSAAEQQIVRMVFLAAKQLAPDLTTAGRSGRALFMAVTRMDGALGTGMARPSSPVGGGLFGLVKSLRQEWADVFCRAVDLSPDLDAEQVAELIIAESGDPDMGLSEVGYGAQGRVTLAADLALGGA